MSRLQERDGSKVPPVTRLLTSGRPLVRPSNWPRTPGQDNTASFLAGHRAPHHDPAFAWTLRVSIAPALCCRATVAARVRVTPDQTPLRQINAPRRRSRPSWPVSGGTAMRITLLIAALAAFGACMFTLPRWSIGRRENTSPPIRAATPPASPNGEREPVAD